VSGCDDGTNWTATGEGAVIFDYSRYMDVRSCRAGLAGSWRRFYRIEIGNITETQRSPWLEISKEIRAGAEAGQNERSVVWSRSLRIEQIRLYARVERKVVERERRQPYAVAVSAVSEDKAKKRTVVILKASRQPLCLLALQTSDPVFSRAVKVEGTDDAEGRQGWLDVGGATITRLRAGGVQQENAGIGLPCPSRYLWYRLTIANLDSPPLQVSGVTATGQVCEAVFFPGAMKRGVLLYGGTGIPAPVYDLQRMAGSLLTAESDRWSLGPETANPGGRGGRRTLSGKTLLVGAVVAMVFVLGWVIAGAARRMPPGGAGEP
jgi:hypothetical protein